MARENLKMDMERHVNGKWLLECGEEKTVHALGNFGSVFELEYFELLLLWFCL